MPVIATWNVNSILARIGLVLDWLRAVEPDIVLLQEIKCVDDAFPRLEIEALGYHVETLGQKSYNGVAILAKRPIEDLVRGLPGDPEDTQARYLEATVSGVRVASIYLPNGNPVTSDKLAYKLVWMERLRRHAIDLLAQRDGPIVLGGDYNVIPEPFDARRPDVMEGDALFLPETRRAWRALRHLGLVDAVRALHPKDRLYSFWDYQGGALQNDHGLRIDHLLLSSAAADRLGRAWIDRNPRGRPKASDHTPVLVEIEG